MSEYKWVLGLVLVLFEIALIGVLPAYFGDTVYLVMVILIMLTVVLTAKS